MAEITERELLSAILKTVEVTNAKVDRLTDETLHLRKEVGEFKRETSNNFNRMERKLRFLEADYEQLNGRIDKLELGDSPNQQ